MGDLSAHELESALQEQAQQKLLDVFAWEQGRAWLQSGIRELSAATPARGLSTERLMRAGVARTPPGRLRALLERHAAQTIEIRPADLADLEPEDTLRSLESGFSVGALMLAQPHATYRGWRSGRLRLNTRGDAAPCPARDLGAELRACSEQDLFHVLGLDLDAETAEVEAAFAARARAYATERLGGASRRERQAAEQIRARLAKAHALLRERAQREAYRERLLVQDDEVDSSASLTAAVCQQAELARAELELRSGDTAAARVTLERMLRAVPHSPEASALYAWVLFLESRCDARRVQQALEIARRAVSCEPALPQPLYYLAMLYRARGKTVRARVLFRRVLGLDPTHAEARRELDRLGDG